MSNRFVRSAARYEIPDVFARTVPGNGTSYRVSYFQAQLSNKEPNNASIKLSKRGSNVWTTLNLNPQSNAAVPIWKDSADNRMSSYVRASRYRGSLHFIAFRVLGDSDRADLAVENCLFSASRHPTAFRSEGAFRCWLVRIALDEALAILHRRRIPERRRGSPLQEASESCSSR